MKSKLNPHQTLCCSEEQLEQRARVCCEEGQSSLAALRGSSPPCLPPGKRRFRGFPKACVPVPSQRLRSKPELSLEDVPWFASVGNTPAQLRPALSSEPGALQMWLVEAAMAAAAAFCCLENRGIEAMVGWGFFARVCPASLCGRTCLVEVSHTWYRPPTSLGDINPSHHVLQDPEPHSQLLLLTLPPDPDLPRTHQAVPIACPWQQLQVITIFPCHDTPPKFLQLPSHSFWLA